MIIAIDRVPGSGKSVFMQELMLSVLGVGGKVFVLDYGRSFKRTCLILGGNYIEFDMKNPISINPFLKFQRIILRNLSKLEQISYLASLLFWQLWQLHNMVLMIYNNQHYKKL